MMSMFWLPSETLLSAGEILNETPDWKAGIVTVGGMFSRPGAELVSVTVRGAAWDPLLRIVHGMEEVLFSGMSFCDMERNRHFLNETVSDDIETLLIPPPDFSIIPLVGINSTLRKNSPSRPGIFGILKLAVCDNIPLMFNVSLLLI